MTFCRSDQFKSFYTRAQTFEFIRSKKGCQNIFQKRDLLGPRTHQKKAACNFSDVCSKSCFWMFDWWFQKLGGSEPTPDGLALTFEFVRSKKGWFCDENVTLSPKVISVNFFENIICWVRSVISFVSSLVKSPSGGKNPWKTTPANPRRALFEKCFKSWFDTVRWWGMSYFFWFAPELLI